LKQDPTIEFPKNKNNFQFMQFVLEVAFLECSFVKHSQGIAGLKCNKDNFDVIHQILAIKFQNTIHGKFLLQLHWHTNSKNSLYGMNASWRSNMSIKSPFGKKLNRNHLVGAINKIFLVL
jgi:hypothetical protein